MGTRADFYIGRGKDAEWLGSVAWDGYPEGFERDGLMNATTAEQFRAAVSAELNSRDDATLPDQGWPWPWSDSNTTDFAYAYDGGNVHASCFGGNWFDPNADRDENDDYVKSLVPTDFPDMKDRANPTMGARSGVMVIQGGGGQ